MKNNIPLETILEKVCEHYKLNADDVKSKRKYGDLARARQMYFFISRKITDYKLLWIGKTVNKDHSLVIFSVKKIEDEKSIYPETKNELHEIYSKIFTQNILFPNLVIEDINLLQLSKYYGNLSE